MFYTIDIQQLITTLRSNSRPGYSLAQRFIDAIRTYNLNDNQAVDLYHRVLHEM